MTYQIVEGDQYAGLLALVEQGRLPAALAVTAYGHDGLWIDSFDASQVDFDQDEDIALQAAIIALRTAYRTARFAGIHPKV